MEALFNQIAVLMKPYFFIFLSPFLAMLVSVSVAFLFERNMTTTEKVLRIKDTALFASLFSGGFVLLVFVFTKITQYSEWIGFSYIGLALFVGVLTVYKFEFFAFFSRLRKSTSKDQFLSKQVQKVFLVNLNVYILKDNYTQNAYATGISRLSKGIFIGEKLKELFSEEEIWAIVCHEVGHIRRRHLPVLCFVSFLSMGVLILGLQYVHPFIDNSPYEGLYVALSASGMYSILFFLIGLVQKKLEYQADHFAALQVGKETYISMLQKLQQTLKRTPTSFSFTHPTFKNRIKNVQKLNSF